MNLARRGVSAKRRSQPSGGFYANAINNPSGAGYPDATNTGVPSGTILTTADTLYAKTDGMTIQDMYVTEKIIVQANNVTIRNCRIQTGDYYPIEFTSPYTGLLVEDTEIIGTSTIVTAGISTANYTARRVRISGTNDGFKADSNVLIEDCYVTGLTVSESSHNDGVQTTGGSNVTVRHNTFKLGDSEGVSAVIQIGVEYGPNSNWLVEDNLMDGGGWTINSAGGDNTMQFLNNRFTRRSGYGVGIMSGSTWLGNYYDNDGAAIT